MPDNTDEAKARTFAELIRREWQAVLLSIIGVGNLLIEAKRSVPHKRWLVLIKSELPFGVRTAQRLMKIAMDERITDATHAPHLPPCWATLYELTKLSDERFQKALELGYIHSKMERADAADLVLLFTGEDTDNAQGDHDPVERLDIQDQLNDARNAYFAEWKKLSVNGRSKELKLCVDAFTSTREEQLFRRLERRKAAEETELMIAESFNAVLDARDQPDADEPE